MVVDDEPDTCLVAKTILQMMGHEVIIAYSGEQALEIMESTPDLLDLIFLDVQLPGISGYDVARAIKANTRLQDVSVILFSAKCREELEEMVREVGATGFISKPFKIADLEKFVGREPDLCP